MSDTYPNYFAIIPAEVRYNQDLKANEKLLYGEITALTSKTGECWASNKYFADLYGVTERSIMEWVSHLKKYGFIQIRYTYKANTKEIDKRIITLTLSIPNVVKKTSQGGEENFVGVVKKTSQGGEENFVDNNTSINNTSINNTRNNIVDRKAVYEEVVGYLNSKLHTDYKPTTKDTKEHINARLDEGFTVDDFKKVIDNKCAEWIGTEWERFLRPPTLFSTKFESYLNARSISKYERAKNNPDDLDGIL